MSYSVGFGVTTHIQWLDAATLARYSASILSLENTVWRESGELYASRPWEVENFALPLPGKEEFSLIAVNEALEEVVGFLVAHSRYGNVHMSRFAVGENGRATAVLMAMYGALFRRMRKAGIRVVTGQVRVQNERTVSVYEGMRFRRLRGFELRNYIASHGLSPVDISEDRFTSSDDFAYFAYSLGLR